MIVSSSSGANAGTIASQARRGSFADTLGAAPGTTPHGPRRHRSQDPARVVTSFSSMPWNDEGRRAGPGDDVSRPRVVRSINPMRPYPGDGKASSEAPELATGQ